MNQESGKPSNGKREIGKPSIVNRESGKAIIVHRRLVGSSTRPSLFLSFVPCHRYALAAAMLSMGLTIDSRDVASIIIIIIMLL